MAIIRQGCWHTVPAMAAGQGQWVDAAGKQDEKSTEARAASRRRFERACLQPFSTRAGRAEAEAGRRPGRDSQDRSGSWGEAWLGTWGPRMLAQAPSASRPAPLQDFFSLQTTAGTAGPFSPPCHLSLVIRASPHPRPPCVNGPGYHSDRIQVCLGRPRCSLPPSAPCCVPAT